MVSELDDGVCAIFIQQKLYWGFEFEFFTGLVMCNEILSNDAAVAVNYSS